MNATVNQELKSGSVVRLSFQIPAEEVRNIYQKIQDKYQKQIQIPGFRRGKVPPAILEKKFGEALKAEAVQEVVNQALTEFLPKAERQPIPYDEPRLVDTDLTLDLSQDTRFHVEYDTYPVFNLPDWKGIEVEEPQVTVSEEDIARKLEELREENALIVPKTEGGAAEGDVVTLDYTECDAQGQAVPGTERQDYVMTLGKNQNIYDIDRDLAGMREGETRTITKDYPTDYRFPELAGTTRTLEVKVKALKTRQLPQLDDDFAQDISDRYQTLNDLKADLKKQLEEHLEERLTDIKIEALLDKLLEKTSIDLPRSLVSYNLQQTWASLAQKYGMTVADLDRSMGEERRRQILEGWIPQAERQLRREIVLRKIEDGLDYTPSDDEVDQELERLARRYNTDVEKLRSYYQDGKLIEQLKNDLKRRYTVRTLVAACKLKKGKKMSYKDFIDEQERKGDN